jgi:acyl-CoA synthetase (AMP-forming)/AMP-acid ligase II
VSSVEIERVCNAAHEDVLETAAIGVPPPGGGPEQLLIVVVLKDDRHGTSLESLKKVFNASIQAKLNPFFKVIFLTLKNLNLCFNIRPGNKLHYLCRLMQWGPLLHYLVLPPTK